MEKRADLILCFTRFCFYILSLKICSWDDKRRFHGSMCNCSPWGGYPHTKMCAANPWTVNTSHTNSSEVMPSFFPCLLGKGKPLQGPACEYVCRNGERQLLRESWVCLVILTWVCPLKLSWMLNCYLRRGVDGNPDQSPSSPSKPDHK